MKVLVAHNFYQQPGGEDRCFRAETELLRRKGHEVVTYTVHNDRIDELNPLTSATKAIWNHSAYQEVAALIRQQRPDVVHFHNTFPLMSPAAFWAAKKHGCPTVVTLHNYRFACPAGTFVREARVCEDCAGHALPWPAVVHGCYRGSRLASTVVASSQFTHRLLRTWSEKIDVFIALTEFARQKFIECGIAERKIALKPNFVDPDPGPAAPGEGYALFVGRLSPEKGLGCLLKAWRTLPGTAALRIVGDGPLAGEVEAAAARSEAIEFLGPKEPDEVMALMANASFLVMPSQWYETFGLVIVEAFARAKPVIASRLGAMRELVEDGETGLHFAPEDAQDLAAKVLWAVEHPDEMRAMGQNARRIFVERYGAEENYARLMEIYRSASRPAPQALR